MPQKERGRLVPPYGVNGCILRVICRGLFQNTNFMLTLISALEPMFHVRINFIQYGFSLLCWTVQQTIFLWFLT